MIRSILLDKNFKLFQDRINNKSRLNKEILLSLFGILYIAFTFKTIKNEIDPMHTYYPKVFSTNSSISMCQYYGYTNLSDPCYIAFGDLSKGNGCSNNLTNFIYNKIKFCSIAQTESERVDYYNQNGIIVPICKCLSTSLFTNKTYVDDENIITAIEFEENNLGKYLSILYN